jgi:hypothetical protein
MILVTAVVARIEAAFYAILLHSTCDSCGMNEIHAYRGWSGLSDDSISGGMIE